MPEQQQILRLAISDAPADYPVASNVELILKQVNAAIDGSGAASAYLPAVVLLSDSGHVIGRYVNRGEPIAAGASAEVTWFPGGGVGGSASSSIVSWGFARGSGVPQSIDGDPANGNPTPINWDPFGSGGNGDGRFFFDPLAPSYLQCHVSPDPGIFLLYASFEHDDDVPTGLTFDDVRPYTNAEAPTGIGSEPLTVKGLVSSNQGDPTVPGAKFAWTLSSWFASRGDTTPIGFQVIARNYAAPGTTLEAVAVRFSVTLIAL